MKIGIDARLYSQTGIGRYIRNLIRVLGEIDSENNYTVFLIKEDAKNFKTPNMRWKTKVINVRWHSFTEQLLMPIILYRENFDLVHFPYFNVPIFYFLPFIVTIHDLTHLHFDTGRASTLPSLLYQIKRLGLRIALWWAINKSNKIIAVSESTKKEIIDHYNVSNEKVIVTYEGIESYRSEITRLLASIPVSTRSSRSGRRSGPARQGDQRSEIKHLRPYLLYVGNAYPHKNLENLILAFKTLSTNKYYSGLKLVLVGPGDFFYQRLKNFVKEKEMAGKIIFYGPTQGERLSLLYQEALALILPSLMEGFGLVGLEAMSQNCPVLASNIPALNEIYGQAAVFFNPKSITDIKEKIINILNNDQKRQELIKKGKERIRLFSWEKMGIKTLELYQRVIK